MESFVCREAISTVKKKKKKKKKRSIFSDEHWNIQGMQENVKRRKMKNTKSRWREQGRNKTNKSKRKNKEKKKRIWLWCIKKSTKESTEQVKKILLQNKSDSFCTNRCKLMSDKEVHPSIAPERRVGWVVRPWRD